LVTLLRPPVVSLDARKPFAARETVKITMFTEAIDKGHASSKATGRHELLSLFIAKLQAGQYRVHVLDDSDFTVMEITSADGSTSALFEVQDEVANATPTKSELISNKYGNRPSRLVLSLEVKTVVVLLLTISRRSVSFLLVLRRKVPMAGRPSDLVQGTLDMLILKTLALEPIHGYGIAVRLEQMSKGVFRLNAGSLFVAFQRSQRDGLISSEWEATENSRRAKYYARTHRGRKKLNSETGEWGRQVAAIAGILEAS
jgi:PadR family transcriptional regulator PadR